MAIDNTDKTRGFTLIELLIVVAIIGIIAAIGYPSYTQYMHKAGRAEGSALLLEVMERQEQHYRRNTRYATALADLGYTGDAVSETGRYIVTNDDISACTGGIRRCVLVEAKAQGKQPAGDDLTLDSKGVKTGHWN